ncbi:MAG TPA: hypothetical protein VFU36_05975 [Jatrophihabitans sp.]|nr:hypothetical protein [Jatrophihabitans sp.]
MSVAMRLPAAGRRLNAGMIAALLVASGGLYLRWAPPAPDLAAQVARAEVVRVHGISSWWTGWFGGMLLPDYSLLSPAWMAMLGVRATAVLAVAVTTAAGYRLSRPALRPRATVLATAVFSFANVMDGRITFAAGIAVASLALLSIYGDRALVLTVALTAAAYAASPLAGFFLGLVLLALAVGDEDRRRPAVAAAGVLVAVALLMAMFFPGTGTMPFPVTSALPAVLCCLLVVGCAGHRTIRLAGGLTLLAIAVLLVVPSPIGENVTRLSWTYSVPVLVATMRSRRWQIAVVLAAVAAWPVTDLVQQLSTTGAPSTRAGYYQPLIDRLQQARAGQPAADLGQRLEVLDTNNHWPTVYLAAMSLARGWDRQADRADNPIFYRPGLTSESYHAWLHSLAVGWIAVPAAPLDYAAQAESRIVAARPGYLRLVWSNQDWQLFRVLDAPPLATGARVTAVAATGIDLAVPAPAEVQLRVRWSPYLTLLSSAGQPAGGCLQDDHGFLRIAVPAAGRYRLVSHFDPVRGITGAHEDCVIPPAG